MKSGFERGNFTRNYIIAALVAAVLFLLLTLWITQSGVLTAVLTGVLIVILVAIYLITYIYVNRAYTEIEKIAETMKQAVEDESRVEFDDKLYEGSIGVLYSNFDKMVQAFEEGKRREQSEKEFLKDVMSDISHQLKTPLASLTVFVDLLMDDKVSSAEERHKLLSEASNQLTRMEWMVLSMLKLARIEAGVIEFDMQDSSLPAVLGQVREGIAYLTMSRSQPVDVTCGEDITVNCDPQWLTEALINIVKNASDYSDAGSAIEIRAEQNSVFTRIYIEDHGMGISEDKLPHIFERFYRVSNAVNPNSVGIGLSLSKSIIEGMDGRISVSSEPGEGTTFSVTFNR